MWILLKQALGRRLSPRRRGPRPFTGSSRPRTRFSGIYLGAARYPWSGMESGGAVVSMRMVSTSGVTRLSSRGRSGARSAPTVG